MGTRGGQACKGVNGARRYGNDGESTSSEMWGSYSLENPSTSPNKENSDAGMGVKFPCTTSHLWTDASSAHCPDAL